MLLVGVCVLRVGKVGLGLESLMMFSTGRVLFQSIVAVQVEMTDVALMRRWLRFQCCSIEFTAHDEAKNVDKAIARLFSIL